MLWRFGIDPDEARQEVDKAKKMRENKDADPSAEVK